MSFIFSTINIIVYPHNISIYFRYLGLIIRYLNFLNFAHFNLPIDIRVASHHFIKNKKIIELIYNREFISIFYIIRINNLHNIFKLYNFQSII